MGTSRQSYRLRPNKHIDRELFAELISLLVTSSSVEDYVYISMGGNHLRDHMAIYRRAGLRKLYAFDLDQEVVDRQVFNVPFKGVICCSHSSAELPARLNDIVEHFKAEHAIIWLDYTKPNRLEQLQEIETIAEKMQVGDILRVTMNADFRGLKKYEAQLTPEQKALPQNKRNGVLLRRMLGRYLPSGIVELDYSEMVCALARCIGRASARGVEVHSDNRFPQPILLTKYTDTTPMLTATMILTDVNGLPEVPKGWEYAPKKWDEIERIVAPDLSARERLALDHLMHKGASEIRDQLGFALDDSAVKSYSKFHRFYPSFQAVID